MGPLAPRRAEPRDLQGGPEGKTALMKLGEEIPASLPGVLEWLAGRAKLSESLVEEKVSPRGPRARGFPWELAKVDR
jgi:hypothetical protein